MNSYQPCKNCLSDPPATPALMVACTESDWIAQNKNYYSWYYSNYPSLIDENISLPVSKHALELFYVLDMRERNLIPLDDYLNCYQYLFEYMIGRLESVITFKGRGFWQRTIENLPVAFNKTMNQITSPFGIPLEWILVGGLAIWVATR